MNNNKKIFILNIELIVNKNLYKNNIIDENTYIKANDILLQKINKIL